MQFDVIVRRICASNILEYLKKEISQDSLAKYFTIVILNFLYNPIINLMKRHASHPDRHVLNCGAYGMLQIVSCEND